MKNTAYEKLGLDSHMYDFENSLIVKSYDSKIKNTTNNEEKARIEKERIELIDKLEDELQKKILEQWGNITNHMNHKNPEFVSLRREFNKINSKDKRKEYNKFLEKIANSETKKIMRYIILKEILDDKNVEKLNYSDLVNESKKYKDYKLNIKKDYRLNSKYINPKDVNIYNKRGNWEVETYEEPIKILDTYSYSMIPELSEHIIVYSYGKYHGYEDMRQKGYEDGYYDIICVTKDDDNESLQSWVLFCKLGDPETVMIKEKDVNELQRKNGEYFNFVDVASKEKYIFVNEEYRPNEITGKEEKEFLSNIAFSDLNIDLAMNNIGVIGELDKNKKNGELKFIIQNAINAERLIDIAVAFKNVGIVITPVGKEKNMRLENLFNEIINKQTNEIRKNKSTNDSNDAPGGRE